MLLARLQLRAPEARCILLAAPTSSADLAGLAEEVDAAAARTGMKSRLVWVPGPGSASDGSAEELASEEDLATPERARARLSGHDGLTIVVGRGILDSPGTLIVASVADAVLLAARRGRTSRSELQEARDEIERAGGRIVGAVLLD